MPRAEHDREDLLREATALVERAEVQVTGCDAPVVAGFRRDGSFSVFFGGDPVYQFNSAGELRRAFAGALPYKAEHGRLISLHRERTASETTLVRQALASEEQAVFLAAARERLQALCAALQSERFMLVGQAPAAADVTGRVRRWLESLPGELVVANRPHSG
jgi:hypothetical protein